MNDKKAAREKAQNFKNNYQEKVQKAVERRKTKDTNKTKNNLTRLSDKKEAFREKMNKRRNAR